MTSAAPINFRLEFAEQLCAILEPDDDVRAILKPGMSSAEFIRALQANNLATEAIRYLAVALPRREAVRWACATHRRLVGRATGDEDAAWAAVEAWVREPSEANRQKCFPIAEGLKFKTPAAYAALGVFWSGGSLAPPDTGQIIPPGPGLTGSVVGASVVLSCVPGEAKHIGDRHAQAVSIGFEIARGGTGLPSE